MTIDLNRYSQFVNAVTSIPSKDLTTFMNRLDTLDANFNYETDTHGPDINIPLLITGALGLAAETGEFCEIPKKMLFQGKPLTEENLFHMKRELGDIMWYWINTCRALNLDPNDVIEENVNKLMSRYPGGNFDIHYSENRREGDLIMHPLVSDLSGLSNEELHKKYNELMTKMNQAYRSGPTSIIPQMQMILENYRYEMDKRNRKTLEEMESKNDKLKGIIDIQ